MTDVEELLRGALTEHAADAPSPDQLVRRVRRRHRRAAVAAIASVVVVVGGIASGLVILLAQPVPRRLPVGGDFIGSERAVAFHGITFLVPSAWGTNNQTCGSPSRNTVVVFSELPSIGCPEVEVHLAHDRVLLEEGPVNSRPTGPIVTRHGVTEEVSHVTRNGQTQTIVVIRSVNVRFAVYTANPVTGRQIVDSIRLATTSPEGCVMRDATVGAQRSRTSDLSTAFLSPSPVSIADCQYVRGWLSGSTSLTASESRRLASQLDTAPRGLGALVGRTCLAIPGGYGFLLRATYADHSVSTVTVGSYCGATVAYSAADVARLSPQLVHRLTGPLNSTF